MVHLKDINKLKDYLNEYKSSLNKKASSGLMRVAERLKDEITLRMGGTTINDFVDNLTGEEFTHTPNVSVNIEDNGNTKLVIAQGEDAIWVEFGSGVYYNGTGGTSPNPLAENIDTIDISIGSYGKGQGLLTSWWFKEGDVYKVSYGTPAQMPIYNAINEIKNIYIDILRKEFR